MESKEIHDMNGGAAGGSAKQAVNELVVPSTIMTLVASDADRKDMALAREIQQFAFTRVDRSRYRCVIADASEILAVSNSSSAPSPNTVVSVLNAMLVSLGPTDTFTALGAAASMTNGVRDKAKNDLREPWVELSDASLRSMRPSKMEMAEQMTGQLCSLESSAERALRLEFKQRATDEPKSMCYVNALRDMLSPFSYTLGCINNCTAGWYAKRDEAGNTDKDYLAEVEQFVALVKRYLVGPVAVYQGAHSLHATGGPGARKPLNRDECVALVETSGKRRRVLLFHADLNRYYG